jgi:hypothetical protein
MGVNPLMLGCISQKQNDSIKTAPSNPQRRWRLATKAAAHHNMKDRTKNGTNILVNIPSCALK